MKVAVADLLPNPYRKMETYPISRANIESLKSKISKTFFWGGLVARPNGKKYELAFGHHRWIALKELGIKEIDITTRLLTDTKMLILMADENHRDEPTPAVMNQTIATVKEFLDGELAKYESWETSDTCIKCLFSNQTGFQESKTKGVGRKTILKFLGPEWTENIIQIALSVLDHEDIIDRKAVERLPTMRRAKEFVQAARKHKIPKRRQKTIIDKIVKEDIGSNQIPDLVAEHAPPELPVRKEKELKPAPMLDDFIKERISTASTLASDLAKIRQGLDCVQSGLLWQKFRLCLRDLQREIEKTLTDMETKNEGTKRKTISG